jgi:hypothetical protein
VLVVGKTHLIYALNTGYNKKYTQQSVNTKFLVRFQVLMMVKMKMIEHCVVSLK